MAGMFGLGAGWANVPVLNLVMGVPLRVSASTSGLLLSVIDTSAAWVYINRGALLPMLVVPSILGVMLGARIGGRLLRTVHAATIRKVVISLMLLAGARASRRASASGPDRMADERDYASPEQRLYAAWLDVGTRIGSWRW